MPKVTNDNDVGSLIIADSVAGNPALPVIDASQITGITDSCVATANKDGTAATPSLRTLGTGAAQACAGNDSRLTDSRTPTGSAGGDLTGTYPNPTIANAAVTGTKIASTTITASNIANATITDTQVAAANKDGLAGTASLRTLGTGATQACAGNDSRLSDNRTDANAVHVNVSGEISAITSKASPVGADLLLIEDSAASNAKKKITINTLPVFGASGTNHTVGYVPDPGAIAGTTKYLREDATWVVPPDPVLVGDSGSGGTAGDAPAPAAGDAAAGKYLKASGAWVTPAHTLQTASATGSTTITGTTYTTINSMTITPGAGDYVVMFMGSMDVNNTARTLFVSLFVGGTQITATEVRLLGTTATVPVSITAPASPTAGQAVDIRWKLSSAAGGPTGTMYNRYLTLLPLKVS